MHLALVEPTQTTIEAKVVTEDTIPNVFRKECTGGYLVYRKGSTNYELCRVVKVAGKPEVQVRVPRAPRGKNVIMRWTSANPSDSRIVAWVKQQIRDNKIN